MQTIKIEPGRTVICDMCCKDYTDSDVEGGLLFGTRAVCPECEPKIIKSAVEYGEEYLIRAHCPQFVRFADWIRENYR